MYLAKSGKTFSFIFSGISVALVACGGSVELEGDAGRPTDAATTDAQAGNPPGTACKAARTATCDFCGNVTCPDSASIFSDCKCHEVTPENTAGAVVAPVTQACNDQCCNIVCPAGEFLDFACACYAP
jgi:hypothetical protein